MNYLEDKTILVTGGVGSIGSNLVKKLLDYNPKKIRVLDINETGLFELENELKSDKIRPFIGDVRDEKRIRRAIENVDVVFHAAAMKHVPLCEYNPFEAINTNVLGTQNVIDSAMDEEVDKFIMISTDKAVNPINVMGATKLLAERLTLSANIYRGNKKTKFSCVRFGNVLNTRGSVITVFRKQISEGGPVTITSDEMIRFFISISKAVELVIKSAEIMEGHEIFILKMDSIKIIDLAAVMIEELAKQKIALKFNGLRHGEKINERLVADEEIKYIHDMGDMVVIKYNHISNKKIDVNVAKVLNKREIKKLLYNEGILNENK